MLKEMYAQCLPQYLDEYIQSMLISDSSLRPCCPKPHTVFKTFDKIHKHIFMSLFFFFSCPNIQGSFYPKILSNLSNLIKVADKVPGKHITTLLIILSLLLSN